MISKNELKFIKSLKIKKYRLLEKRFLVEGAKSVLELVSSSTYKTDLIVCTDSFLESYHSKLTSFRVEVVTKNVLSQIGTFQSNEDAIAIARFPLESKKLNFDQSIFVLDAVRDPGNLGTIIRTLDWFGFMQVFCSNDCAELYNPKVISSSMGAFLRVNIAYGDTIELLSKTDLPVYGAFMNGTPLPNISFPEPNVVVLGSESHGIKKETEKFISEKFTIPQIGRSESLNVGVATGIIAFHLRNPK